MKIAALFAGILIFLSGAIHAQTARPGGMKLSDQFSKASIIALNSIAGDLFVPQMRDGKIVVAGPSQSRIDEADAEAVTKPELQMIEQVRAVFIHRMSVNIQRARARAFWAGIEINPKSPDGKYLSGLEAGEDLCREALITLFRRRSPGIPASCTAMMKDEFSQPESKP